MLIKVLGIAPIIGESPKDIVSVYKSSAEFQALPGAEEMLIPHVDLIYKELSKVKRNHIFTGRRFSRSRLCVRHLDDVQAEEQKNKLGNGRLFHFSKCTPIRKIINLVSTGNGIRGGGSRTGAAGLSLR